MTGAGEVGEEEAAIAAQAEDCKLRGLAVEALETATESEVRMVGFFACLNFQDGPQRCGSLIYRHLKKILTVLFRNIRKPERRQYSAVAKSRRSRAALLNLCTADM